MKYPGKCEVCKEPFTLGGWAIRHGEGICATCGAVYMLAGEDAPVCQLDDKAKRVGSEYYEETGRVAVWVSNDGVTEKDSELFTEWLENNYPSFLE